MLEVHGMDAAEDIKEDGYNGDEYEEGQRLVYAADGENFATLDDDTRTDDTRKSYQASLNQSNFAS